MFFQYYKFSVLILPKLCVYLGWTADLGTLAHVLKARDIALRRTAFIYLQDHMFDVVLTVIDSLLFGNTQKITTKKVM